MLACRARDESDHTQILVEIKITEALQERGSKGQMQDGVAYQEKERRRERGKTKTKNGKGRKRKAGKRNDER